MSIEQINSAEISNFADMSLRSKLCILKMDLMNVSSQDIDFLGV